MAGVVWEFVPPFGGCLAPTVCDREEVQVESDDAVTQADADVPRETSAEDPGAQPGPQAAPRWPEDVAALRGSLRLLDDDVVPEPTATRIIAIANQKGGVAKTTTAVNLAASLVALGRRVLVVDMDPQGNATTALGLPHDPGTPGTYDILVNGKSVRDSLSEMPELPALRAIPATVDLAGAEIELVSQVARETRLRKALTEYLAESDRAGQRIDYVLIDCPPSLGLLTVNALVAAREVLIPLQSEYYALEGLTHLLGTIGMIREHLNAELRIGAILLTMFDGRTRLAPQVADEVRTHFPDQLMATVIPRSVRVSEAPSYGQTVLQYDPGSPGSRAYLAAARELADRGEREPAP